MAHAYCRTRTCDTDNSCDWVDGCSAGGHEAFWPSGCLPFAIQRDASPAQGISTDEAREIAEDAFALWTNSECLAGGTPPLTFAVLPNIECHVPEFNCDPKDWNANVVLFQDEGWAHDASALAVTCVTMNLNTGEILDADIELNSSYFQFALPGEEYGADLHTVLAHEAGHLLGLNHSDLNGSVMFAKYDNTVLINSLSDDDIAGVCDIYGGKDEDPVCKQPELPDDTSCVGESACVPVEDEGCSCVLVSPGSLAGLPWLFLPLALAAARRRVKGSRARFSPHSTP